MSLGTKDKREARRVLRERMQQTAPADRQTCSVVTWDTAGADLLAYYRAYGTRHPWEAAIRIRTLTRYFAGVKLADIDAAAILSYVAHRQRQGRAAGTINVELATLRRALRLAQEYGKLGTVPKIRMLRPAAPRSGFFERGEFEAVCQHLPIDLQVVARIAYTYGWRITSEVLPLTWAQVDQAEGTLRLEPGSTKNRDGRTVYLTSELRSLLAAQLDRAKALERELGQAVPYVFPVAHGRYRGGPRRDIRKVWRRACREAGLPGKLKHDLRRTASAEHDQLGRT
jgi:integrase